MESPADNVHDVIVIGAGPAGATAAIYAVRAGLKTLVIDKGLTAGSLGKATKIANYPGIQEIIDGPDLARRMRQQAESFGAVVAQGRVLGTILEGQEKQVQSTRGIDQGRALIVATGSMGRSATVPGEEQLLGRGVSYCATCDAAFFRDEVVAVAGNNDEALEEALFLTRVARRVHLLAQTAELWASDDLVAEATDHEKVIIHPSTRLQEIVGDEGVEAVKVFSRDDGEQTLPVTGVFLYLQGRQPITDFLGGQLNLSPTGCIEVDDMMQASVPGVFAAGDVLCNHVKQVVIAAAEGARAAIAAERYLSGRENLRPDWA